MESDDNVYDYQTRIKSLPKVKYSSLTERESCGWHIIFPIRFVKIFHAVNLQNG